MDMVKKTWTPHDRKGVAWRISSSMSGIVQGYVSKMPQSRSATSWDLIQMVLITKGKDHMDQVMGLILVYINNFFGILG